MVAHDKNQSGVVVTGVVMPAERDLHGNIVGLAIETDDFETFVVESANSTDGLFELIDEKVRVRGEVHGRDIHDNPVLKIEAFELAE